MGATLCVSSRPRLKHKVGFAWDERERERRCGTERVKDGGGGGGVRRRRGGSVKKRDVREV